MSRTKGLRIVTVTVQRADFMEYVNGNRLVTCMAEDARRGLQIQQAIYDSYKTKNGRRFKYVVRRRRPVFAG